MRALLLLLLSVILNMVNNLLRRVSHGTVCWNLVAWVLPLGEHAVRTLFKLGVRRTVNLFVRKHLIGYGLLFLKPVSFVPIPVWFLSQIQNLTSVKDRQGWRVTSFSSLIVYRIGMFIHSARHDVVLATLPWWTPDILFRGSGLPSRLVDDQSAFTHWMFSYFYHWWTGRILFILYKGRRALSGKFQAILLVCYAQISRWRFCLKCLLLGVL